MVPKLRNACLACLALWGAIGHALAQAPFASKPLRILVGYAPGGAADILARLMAQHLGEGLRQQVLVENRTGATGVIAAELVAKSPPDGYTMLLAPTGHTVAASLGPKLPFHPVRDFSALSQIAVMPNVLVVHPSLPVRSVRDLINLARARPDELTHGSSGTGSPGHLSGEVFKLMTGVRFVHIAYRGSSQALVDLLGGHVQIAFPTTVAVQAQLKGGRLRALAVTSLQRSSSLPDIPTVAESGVPGFEVVGWYGLLAPAGLPREIQMRLGGEIARIVRSDPVRERLVREGAESVGDTPDEFGRFLAADVEKWAKVVAAVGIRTTQ
jgi:tripartite-type tricarboxylate transporter receptor subunit TctC